METHKLLSRQLEHAHLSFDKLPDNLATWQEFMSRVNNFYKESDEERYMIERSMYLSSREIMDLNAKLENAQEIAGLGYWTYDAKTDRFFFSKVLRETLQISPVDPITKYKAFVEMVDPDYQAEFQKCMDQAMQEGLKYQIEIPIISAEQKKIWLYVVGEAVKTQEAPYTQLTGIAMNITENKKSEDELQSLNSKLISSAREVGKADVAVSILHNVGNVLNSVNVSSNILVENLQKSHFNRFFDVSDMLKQHAEDLHNYLSNDPKGKLIPNYLIALADSMRENYDVSCQEVANINEKIQHIRDIVMSQQALSRVNGITEKMNLRDVMKATILMLGTQLVDKKIELIEDYQDVPEIFVDRSKLVQILVNLIQNAKDALIENLSADAAKKITIIIRNSKSHEGMAQIVVQDNGVGISPENLGKIFSYGFSTKNNGHGIGLHSSALTATELGGKLYVESDGLGKGARFILDLPLTIKSEEKADAGNQ